MQNEDTSKSFKSLQAVIQEYEIKTRESEETHKIEKERIKHENEREVAHLKSQIQAIESSNVSHQQRLLQKETKLNELEQNVKDLKFKIHDLELQISNLGSKLQSKESNIHELEVLNGNLNNLNDKIKQKISENEVQFMNLNTKITENEAKLQRSENLLSSSIATVNSKDLRIVEYKNQVDVQLDSMSKLERDKKEAQKQLDDMTYQNSSMNADIKLLRNNMNETELELSKTKSNLENIQRDMQREMNLLEERHKTIFSKLTSDRDQEILFLKSESSTLKTTHINEINRLAQEREELIRFQEKEYQTTIDLLKKKLEAALDYNQDLQVKHKGDINEKLEGIRQSTSNEVLNTKTKFSVMVDMLRENLAEVTSKLNETESKLTQRDTTLKMLEIENVKKSFEQKQLQDDYALSKENSIRSEESHYLTLKNIQRDLEDKSSKLLKASELAEELTNIKQTLQASMEIMKSENLQLIEKFSNSTLISGEYKEKAEIEIQGLQKQVLNFEKIVHESKLLIETLENREKSSLETIESLKSNIQDIKELSESSKIGSIASSQGIKELEECLANLNSTFETKCKEVENLESLLSNKNAEIKLREDTNMKLDIKIENLEKKLVDSLEDCIKFKSDIEHLREESFKSISEEQECHKKLFKAQKKKHAQIIAELGGKAVVESNLLKETHQQIVQKLDQDYQNTLTELNAKTNEYDQLYHSYTFLQKEHKGLETLYLDLQVREHGIVVDLESKVQLLLQMKKKLKNIEVENQIQSGKLSTLIQDLDESKLQFVSIQSQHHSLLLREQKVELELDYSKKTILGMEQKILELNKTRDEYLTLQVNFEEKSRVLAKSESQGATFQRLIAKQTKMVASLQITLLEMSKVVSMELPWTMEDVLHLPDKIKLCFKSSKETIPFELLDSNILLELVNRVRDGFIEREDFLAEIELQVKKINDLELANTNAISQLKNASLAITSIEKRTTSERNIEIGELEESQLKIVDLEKNLEKSLFERQKFEKALQKLRQDYDIALKEKELVEQDFVNVYENYQNSKAIFLEKTNAINVDSTILVEDNSKAILKLEEQRLEIEELSYTCQTLSKEKDGLYKQKMDLEKQLKACRVEIRDFGTRLSTLILDKEKLEEQLQFDENNHLNTLLNKDADYDNLIQKYENQELKIKLLGDTIKNINLILEDIKHKFCQSIKRESELEKRNQKLQLKISDYEYTMENINLTDEEVKEISGKYDQLVINYEKLKKEKAVTDFKLESSKQKRSSENYRTIRNPLPDPYSFDITPRTVIPATFQEVLTPRPSRIPMPDLSFSVRDIE
jgi:chromosome segregation ATPase